MTEPTTHTVGGARSTARGTHRLGSLLAESDVVHDQPRSLLMDASKR